MDIIKHIAVIIVLLGFVKATNLTEFIGLWQGVETLSSPTTSHQDRSIYLNIKTNSDDETNLVYTSNSNFIYNGYLNWASHHFYYDKNTNQVIFERKFTTPLGLLATQEIIYDIITKSDNELLIKYISEDGLITHSIDLTLSTLSIEPKNLFPSKIGLGSNYPNPFNPSTAIPVFVNENTVTDLSIYDVSGNLIRKIQIGELRPGIHQFHWDGLNHRGKKVSAGTYMYRLTSDNSVIAKKMILLK